jgi:outer membrane protein TolC
VGGDVGIALPIFHRKVGDVQEVVAERERAALEVQSLERTIAQEVLDARRSCADAAVDLQTFQGDIIPRNQENFEIGRRLTAQGGATVAELIGVQTDLLSAQSDYLDALQTYNESLIELERVIGGSLDAR